VGKSLPERSVSGITAQTRLSSIALVFSLHGCKEQISRHAAVVSQVSVVSLWERASLSPFHPLLRYHKVSGPDHVARRRENVSNKCAITVSTEPSVRIYGESQSQYSTSGGVGPYKRME
jgi:hypothetical protein